MSSSVNKPITGSGPRPPNSADFGWSEAELIDPHRSTEKAAKVRRMFGAIARSYDLNNRLHSFWRDQAWRRHAVKSAGVRTGDAVVDVACGTGDLTELFARSGAASVVGVDFTPEMLEVAGRRRERLAAGTRDKITYLQGDAQALPLADASADIVSIAFGLRNVQDPAGAVRELVRILRPGGRLVILEFGRPSFPPARWANDFYCGWLMPRTATLISGDRTGAYRYLPRSVGSFMARQALCGLLSGGGLAEVSATPLTFGICICYRAVKPAPR